MHPEVSGKGGWSRAMEGVRQHDIVKPDRLWAVAICTPAIRFVSNGRAERPTTYCLIFSNAISAAAIVTLKISESAARRRISTCVTCIRAHSHAVRGRNYALSARGDVEVRR